MPCAQRCITLVAYAQRATSRIISLASLSCSACCRITLIVRALRASRVSRLSLRPRALRALSHHTRHSCSTRWSCVTSLASPSCSARICRITLVIRALRASRVSRLSLRLCALRIVASHSSFVLYALVVCHIFASPSCSARICRITLFVLCPVHTVALSYRFAPVLCADRRITRIVSPSCSARIVASRSSFVLYSHILLRPAWSSHIRFMFCLSFRFVRLNHRFACVWCSSLHKFCFAFPLALAFPGFFVSFPFVSAVLGPSFIRLALLV
ncbi:hypothetical protein K438DRAFT_2028862 [Mycena galopus ATCC 62051]|nr:hypothetical protein K438DRAFT_2028862 [Mycena galopus ATCC 62051]